MLTRLPPPNPPPRAPQFARRGGDLPPVLVVAPRRVRDAALGLAGAQLWSASPTVEQRLALERVGAARHNAAADKLTVKDLKVAVKEATGLEISDVNYTVEVLTGFALVSKTRSYVAAKKSEKKGANTHALVLAAYEEKTPGASEAAAVHAPLALPPSEGEGSLEGDENLLSGAAYGRGCCPLERGIEEQVVAECARAYPEGVACADLARNFNLHVKPFGKRVSEMILYKHWYGLEEREMYIPGGRTKGKFLFLAAATAEAKGLEPKPPLARGGLDAAEELRAKRARDPVEAAVRGRVPVQRVRGAVDLGVRKRKRREVHRQEGAQPNRRSPRV